MGKKRGQITIFIAVAVVILILGAISIYLASQFLKPKGEVVSEELKPIKIYVEDCANKLASDAIKKIGLQGGYIEIPDRISTNKNMHIALTPNQKIPYWYYAGQNINPALTGEGNSIQSQLQEYINTNLASCLQEFVRFSDVYDIKEMGVPATKVTFGENEVVVETKYEIDITNKEKTVHSKITFFRTTIPVKLKQIYDVATKMLAAENEQLLLEKTTIDLMALNPDIPFTDIQFHCGRLKWTIDDIKTKVQGMVYYNFPKIRIKNTKYPPFQYSERYYERFRGLDSSEDQVPQPVPDDLYDYYHFFFDVDANPTKIATAITYQPDWGMDINARPSDNGILVSNSAQGPVKFLPYLCVNVYHFNYDVTFPVEVLLKDSEAFNNEGYVFRFGLPIYIDHNEGNRANPPIGVFSASDYDSGFCENTDGIDREIITKDTNGNGVDEAEITFTCLKYYCPLGKTEPINNAYRLITQLPKACENGRLIAKKENYLQGELRVASLENQYFVQMVPMKEFNYDIKKQIYDAPTGIYRPSQDLEADETAYIHLTLSNGEDYDETVTSNIDKTIRLIDAPEDYTVEIVLVKDYGDRVEVIGGYYNELRIEKTSGTSAHFTVLEYRPTPVKDEDKTTMVEYLQNNKDYKEKLKPRFE